MGKAFSHLDAVGEAASQLGKFIQHVTETQGDEKERTSVSCIGKALGGGVSIQREEGIGTKQRAPYLACEYLKHKAVRFHTHSMGYDVEPSGADMVGNFQEHIEVDCIGEPKGNYGRIRCISPGDMAGEALLEETRHRANELHSVSTKYAKALASGKIEEGNALGSELREKTKAMQEYVNQSFNRTNIVSSKDGDISFDIPQWHFFRTPLSGGGL